MDVPGPRRGSRLFLFVPRDRAAHAVPRVSFARFTDLQLSVRYKDSEVVNFPIIPEKSPDLDHKDRYRGFHDRTIRPVED
jgi:hypothetical protein